MKAKGIYFLYSKIDTSEPDGIERKIMAQRQLFCNSGIEMEYEVLKRGSNGCWIYKDYYSKVDFIYFRKSTTIDWRFLSFYSKIKKNGTPIIFMEIPTFPYDGEYGNTLRSKIALMVDHFFRRYLVACIDRIVITGAHTTGELWGVKTIDVVNGVDFNQIQPRKYIMHEGVNLTCVAKFSPWHGYERLLGGLADYYKSKNPMDVNILMVGDGEELSYYERLVSKYNLSEHVKFFGRLTGEKLDNIYNITDIGVCSLGRFKSGIEVIGDLKSREFMAKGIPMVCGCKIDVLQGKDYKYAIIFPNNEDDIDISKVLDWYFNVKNDEHEVSLSDKIRELTKGWIDFSMTYKEVVTQLDDLLWNK